LLPLLDAFRTLNWTELQSDMGIRNITLNSMRITEINIIPIKPDNGLIGFASVVLNSGLYLGSFWTKNSPLSDRASLLPKFSKRDFNEENKKLFKEKL
jgi:hypothetical protein